jgi:hypothetical protein
MDTFTDVASVDMERHAMEVARLAESGAERAGHRFAVDPPPSSQLESSFTSATPPPPPPFHRTSPMMTPTPPHPQTSSSHFSSHPVLCAPVCGDDEDVVVVDPPRPPPSHNGRDRDEQLPVYSPVDDTYASWTSGGRGGTTLAMSSAAAAPTGVDVSAANDDDEDDDVDEDYSRGVLDVTPNPPPDDDDYDIDDVENIANVATEDGRNVSRSSSAANSSASASRRRTHSTQPIEYGMENDDALARAIAEQDLPPGVSVAEQQEVMMRLLTQRIRRGDRDDDDGHGGGGVGEKLSPALEARLRDFNFAQGKRRERYGEDRPWGILGLYDHLGEFIHPLSFLSLLLFFIFVTIC